MGLGNKIGVIVPTSQKPSEYSFLQFLGYDVGQLIIDHAFPSWFIGLVSLLFLHMSVSEQCTRRDSYFGFEI